LAITILKSCAGYKAAAGLPQALLKTCRRQSGVKNPITGSGCCCVRTAASIRPEFPA